MTALQESSRHTTKLADVPLDSLNAHMLSANLSDSAMEANSIVVLPERSHEKTLFRDPGVTPHDWSYQRVMANPKGDHGIVAVPRTSELASSPSFSSSSSSSSPRSASPTHAAPRAHWHR